MRNRAWLLRLRHLLQSQVGRGGVSPVALQLVNAYEVLERRGGIVAFARELLEQLFGPVVEAGPEVVARELDARGFAMSRVDVLPIDDVLVNLDRAVDLTSPPVQAAQSEVRFDRVVVAGREAQKCLECAIRLVVKQVAEAFEMPPTASRTATPMTQRLHDGPAPADRERPRQRPPEEPTRVSRHRAA
jgi:hypothetical protein